MEALGLLIHGFAVLLTWKTLLLMMLGVLGIFRRGAARPRRPERRSDPAAANVYDGSNLGDRDAVLHLLGALFGGAITSILFNIPGEAWSVATNRGCHPCLVVNFHPDGAMLHSSTHHTAAFRFDLSLDGFKTTRHCRVVWRNENTCGVKFVDNA